MGTATAPAAKKDRIKTLNKRPDLLVTYIKLYDARKRAHECLDQLWKGPKAPFTRQEAYEIMRDVMGLTSKEAHISSFTWQQCEAMIWKFIIRGLA